MRLSLSRVHGAPEKWASNDTHQERRNIRNFLSQGKTIRLHITHTKITGSDWSWQKTR